LFRGDRTGRRGAWERAFPAIVGERAVRGADIAPAGIERFPHSVEWILPKYTGIQ